MRTTILIAGLVACLALPAHATTEQNVEPASKPALGTLMDMFGMTTLATAYYAHCKPASLAFTDAQIVTMMQNNVALRTLMTVYLLIDNKDVEQLTMASFVKAATVGLQTEIRHSVKTDGCGADKWERYNEYLKKVANEDLRTGIKEMETRSLSVEQAKEMLESMKE